jgi:hypothetical protein
MGLQNQNASIINAVELGNNGPSVSLNNRPTLNVSRSTAESPTKVISLAGIAAVNFQAGVNAILQSATLVNTQVIVFVNTQPGLVTLSLDNGGTVAGQAVYALIFGTANNPVTLQFGGTNLHT